MYALKTCPLNDKPERVARHLPLASFIPGRVFSNDSPKVRKVTCEQVLRPARVAPRATTKGKILPGGVYVRARARDHGRAGPQMADKRRVCPSTRPNKSNYVHERERETPAMRDKASNESARAPRKRDGSRDALARLPMARLVDESRRCGDNESSDRVNRTTRSLQRAIVLAVGVLSSRYIYVARLVIASVSIHANTRTQTRNSLRLRVTRRPSERGCTVPRCLFYRYHGRVSIKRPSSRRSCSRWPAVRLRSSRKR